MSLGVSRLSVAGAGLAGAFAVLLLSEDVWAGLPEMEQALVRRAREEWFTACPNSSTTGVACQANVCGVDFVLDPGGVVRNFTVDGQPWDLHAGGGQDYAVAELINAACNVSSIMGTGQMALQNGTAFDFFRHSLHRAQVTATPGPMVGVGGTLEYGTNASTVAGAPTTYKAGIVPFTYAHSFSRDRFFNLNGTLSYAFAPQSGQFAMNAVPSYGMLGGDADFNWGLGAYAPIAFANSAYSVLDHSLQSYNLGLGAVGVFNKSFQDARLSGGAVLDGRYSSTAGGVVPMNALVHFQYPVLLLVDAFGSASFGIDPLHSGTTAFSLRVGAETGSWQFGYQIYLASGYTGHLLGFMYRQELKQTKILEPPADAPPETTKPEPKD
jgi:hypothetical protein